MKLSKIRIIKIKTKSLSQSIDKNHELYTILLVAVFRVRLPVELREF